MASARGCSPKYLSRIALEIGIDALEKGTYTID